MIEKSLLIAVAMLFLGASVIAQTTFNPSEGDLTIKDFRFESGEVLPELTLHYRTLGKPQRDTSGVVRNAVLLLHGTGGSGTSFLSQQFGGVLFGPGQLLDTSKYFIVMPDSIGHGKSSKPSNGLHARFPQYNYNDMVTAQYRVLTEALGINHLRLVLGTSMGGMHTWVWGEKYPDFMDALMPLACLPYQISGRNRMLRRMIIDAIKTDPEWNNGEYKQQPRGLTTAVYVSLFTGSSPLQLQKNAPTRDAADKLLESQVRAGLNGRDANDLLYQYDSSRDYDPEPQLDKIKAHLIAINSADDQTNPPELGIAEREIKKVKNGEFVLIPISDETRGHGTHSLPKLWQQHLKRLLEKSETNQ